MKEYKTVETKVIFNGEQKTLKSIPLGCTLDFEIIGDGKFKEIITPINGFWRRFFNKLGRVSLCSIRIYKFNIWWRNPSRVTVVGDKKWFFRVFITN